MYALAPLLVMEDRAAIRVLQRVAATADVGLANHARDRLSELGFASEASTPTSP